MDHKKCHLCGGELFADPILRLKGMPKAAQYYPNEDEFAKDAGIDLNIFQCSSCGLVRLNMKPVEYFREVITAATLSERSRASRLEQMKGLAAKFALTGKKVLDIGSGKGEMLDVLKEADLVATGIEASKASVDIGKAAGRTMVHGYIGEVSKISGGPFDAFISLNYLEHLPQPGDIIRKIYDNTSDGAVGFVTVPNLDYLLKTRSFYEFVADHLSYFTKKTLPYAFEMNGFDVLECKTINEDNDIAITVKKKEKLDISGQYIEVESLIKDLQKIMAEYRSKKKRIAVWGAGHRTLALMALAGMKDVAYVVDSAKFKQGRYTPSLHLKIVAPEELKKDKVDLVMIMVPGLYPAEVMKTVKGMGLGVDIAVLRDNKIEFMGK
jgi:2-polyprenyl-3-methyl-5-hydroxy-6-metoxy-1,4-benzoquinol methylase